MLARQFLVVLPWITKIVIFERFIWKNKAMIDNFLDRVQIPNVDNFGKSQNYTKKDVSKIGKHNFANMQSSTPGRAKNSTHSLAHLNYN